MRHGSVRISALLAFVAASAFVAPLSDDETNPTTGGRAHVHRLENAGLRSAR